MSLLHWLEEHLQGLAETPHQDEFLTQLTVIAARLGFEYIAISMRAPYPLDDPPALLLSNYPSVWQRFLRQIIIGRLIPSFRTAANQIAPWSGRTAPGLIQNRSWWMQKRTESATVGRSHVVVLQAF